jgi:uncharacterized protein YgiM (DUF1202 family)
VLLLNGNYSRAASLLLKRQTPITSTCREMFTEKKDDNTQQIRYIQYIVTYHGKSGHSTAAEQIVRLIAFVSRYFVFKNENVKVKVKYGFVL